MNFIIDLFTRWVEVEVFHTSPTAPMIATAFIKAVVSKHGSPQFIVSDNGPYIVASLITNVCRSLGTHRIYISPYCPQTNRGDGESMGLWKDLIEPLNNNLLHS